MKGNKISLIKKVINTPLINNGNLVYFIIYYNIKRLIEPGDIILFFN